MEEMNPKFNVLFWDFNKDKPEYYDILPYLYNKYNKLSKSKKPTTFEGVKKFIIDESSWMWWGKCQYEILLKDWPCEKHSYKIDIYEQINMNLDLIVNTFISGLKPKRNGAKKNSN